MSGGAPRFVVVASTAGSVLNQCLSNGYFRERIHSVVVDQPCAAADRAQEHGPPVVSLFAEDNDAFCAHLLDYLVRERIDYVLSFYTRFYSKPLRDAYRDRIVNLHPSILPAFKGMDGFGDQMRYHVPFVGSTVELIDEAMDEGKIIMQALFPRDPALALADVRHRLFVQQCRSLIQVVAWLDEGRVNVEGRHVSIVGSRYGDPEFSPSLDSHHAIALCVPDLQSAKQAL